MFDAIVVGSGMSGGISAKELCERGLKVLVIERGRKLVRGESYTDNLQPWEVPNAGMVPEEDLARHHMVQKQTSMPGAKGEAVVQTRRGAAMQSIPDGACVSSKHILAKGAADLNFAANFLR